MIIRPIIESDLQNGYLELLSQLTNVGTGDFTARFHKIQANENIIILVAFDESVGKVIGAGTIWFEQKFIHGCSNVAHIEDVVVNLLYRSQNIGKTIIDKLVAIAQKSNCYKVILNCSESVCGFYQKCGFIKKNLEMAHYF